MPTNDFLPFGFAEDANVMSQAEYLTLAARNKGFSAGTAKSEQLNKAWRQASLIATSVAQTIADVTGQQVLDDGTTDQIVANLKRTIQSTLTNYGADTGAANAYVVSYTPAVLALSDGMTLKFKAKTANTGVSTFNPNNLGAKPLVGRSLSPLQNGEIVANSMVVVQYNISAGSGSWVLVQSTGGDIDSSQADAVAGTDNKKRMSPLRVAQAIAAFVVQATESVTGTAKVASQASANAGIDDSVIVTPKKMRFGFAASFNANGYIVFPQWLGGWIVQWISSASISQGGAGSASWVLAFPNACLFALAAPLGTSANSQAGNVVAGGTSVTGVNLYNWGPIAATAKIISIGA